MAWARRPARWSLAMGRRGFGDWPMTVGHKPANGGLLPCHPTSGGRRAGALWRRQGPLQDLAQALGQTTQTRFLPQSHPTTGGNPGVAAQRRDGASPCQRGSILSRTPEPHGLSGRGRAGETIGSGPVEATCRQTQCRFKRPGQFWSVKGDEALLCLETFWRNHRWHLLFPHTGFNPARN